MSDQLITCPSCQTQIPLSEAIMRQVKDDITRQTEKDHLQALEKAKQEIAKQASLELELVKQDLASKKKLLEESHALELELRKQKNSLEEEKRSFELEKQRQLDMEREKIRAKTLEEAQESQRLKIKEYEKKLEDMTKAVEEAQRKATQGSQQLQGEVQELDLESSFRVAFPADSIEPIAKGVLGADIRHIVKSPKGVICGTILWESKRTKAWSDGWLSKLNDDLIADRANIPAIISESLPEEAKNGIGLKNGIWIATPRLALPLAMLLRQRLLDATRQKVIAQNKQTDAEELYNFVTSHEFQHQVESMIQIYSDMHLQIQKERMAFEKSWKQREAQVQKLMMGLSGMYGSIQGRVGAALPAVKNLEPPEETVTQESIL